MEMDVSHVKPLMSSQHLVTSQHQLFLFIISKRTQSYHDKIICLSTYVYQMLFWL